MIDPARDQRLATIESKREKVLQDLDDLNSLFRETFHDGSEIWGESRVWQKTILEEFRDAKLDYQKMLQQLQIEKSLVLEGLVGFIVEEVEKPGPGEPPEHIEGYEWTNPTIIEEDPESESTDSVRLGSDLSRDGKPTGPPRGGLNEIKAILAQNQTVPNERKLAMISRFAWVSAGLSLRPEDGACAYTIMRRAVEHKGDTDLEVSPQLRAALHSLVELWQTQPDSTYWTNVGHMIDLGVIVNGARTTFTLADQIFVTNFVVGMSPLKDLWSWKTMDDVWQVANAIKAFYDKSHLSSDMYRHACEVTYRGRVMPRGVTARMLQLALGLIAKDIREKTVS
jgi:hypothetical protein